MTSRFSSPATCSAELDQGRQLAARRRSAGDRRAGTPPRRGAPGRRRQPRRSRPPSRPARRRPRRRRRGRSADRSGPLPGRPAHPSTGGEAAEHLLVGRPQPLRLDERLVVEAGAEEAADELVGRLHVVVQGRPGVLRAHVHPRFQAAVGAADVRLVTDLHQAAWLVERRGQQTSRPVVLEAAGEDGDAGRGQRRGDGVAIEAAVVPTVPRELQGRLPIDLLAGLGLEAGGPLSETGPPQLG